MPGFDFENIPGITSTYIDNEAATDSMFSSWNIFFLFLVVVLGGIFYKMRNRKVGDDEFVKTEDKGVYEKFFNPFNRKDGDDDFDKVL